MTVPGRNEKSQVVTVVYRILLEGLKRWEGSDPVFGGERGVGGGGTGY